MTDRGRGGGVRVGVYGLIGTGNLGNDASFDVVLAHLRARHPDAVVDVMTPAPEQVRARYGLDATVSSWVPSRRLPRPFDLLALGAGKVADAWRTARWVRRHDVVLVPGMGVLEASLPMRPWEAPYAFALLGLCCGLLRTPLALVGVGADDVARPLTRRLLDVLARRAGYRSYRDEGSRDAMRRRGIDVSHDPVHPDLVLGRPVPDAGAGDPRLVCVGVMAYHGGNDDDRAAADRVLDAYAAKVVRFVLHLVDHGYDVRLVVGDACDVPVAERVDESVREARPGLPAARLRSVPVTDYDALTAVVAGTGTVVATRFHNVVCGLALARPTIAVWYARKSADLMADLMRPGFDQPVATFDVDLLVEQFDRLQADREAVVATLRDRRAVAARGVAVQLEELSAFVAPPGDAPPPGPAVTGRGPAPRGRSRAAAGPPPRP
ncbi:polysaccharide pyruvyl transferase family protein [Kineosporia sp. R_H_3]|uniref:polysaccharide pyruvyl transferase family protein n=1 Tax=Kineosporia sp. R_H_3 TaxID=1961848 RepID=UPI000B4BC3F7|nr:polysaccharide pyruvyl transferase family protein [Kineosporia sp. R_H_3]